MDEKKNLLWGLLLHVGGNINKKVYDPLRLDIDVFHRITERMAADGLNMVLIDVLESLRYPSHPELGVKGALEPEAYAEELARLRRLGLTPLPKLNFSTAHHAWLGEYSRMVATPEYYKVCADVIGDVAKLFGNPEYFHIGMDEESKRFVLHYDYAVMRQGDLWWHDLEYLVREVESHGCRACMWCDRYWYHHDEFVKRASKKVVMSNYFYGNRFDLEAYKRIFDKDPIGYHGMTTYANLEKDGFDQLPTCSNYLSPGYQKNHPGVHNVENTPWTVEHCKKTIAPERLKGFLSAPWMRCVPEHFDYLCEASKLLGDAKKKFYG